MQFLVVVSDFPKVTETFVLRNVMHYLKAGHAVTVFHTKPYRDAEVVHSTYAPVVERSLDLPWLPRAAFRELVRSPGRVLSVLSQIVVAFARDPRHLAVSLVLMPKSLGLAAHVRSAGVTHIQRFLERLPGFPSNKVEVLRCGVEVPTDVAAPPTGPFRIVFVGALLARKGVDVLLDAVAGLPNTLDWRLDIVGGGSQEAAVRRQVEGLPDGRVRFLGPQPSGEVAGRKRVAEAFDIEQTAAQLLARMKKATAT